MKTQNLFTRDDTFFGICEGLGEDLGIHPNLLRLALALTLFWSPLVAVAAYVIAGVVVLATRLLIPNKPAATMPVVVPAKAEAATVNDNAVAPTTLAA